MRDEDKLKQYLEKSEYGQEMIGEEGTDQASEEVIKKYYNSLKHAIEFEAEELKKLTNPSQWEEFFWVPAIEDGLNNLKDLTDNTTLAQVLTYLYDFSFTLKQYIGQTEES